jgi:hypothetical protein
MLALIQLFPETIFSDFGAAHYNERWRSGANVAMIQVGRAN